MLSWGTFIEAYRTFLCVDPSQLPFIQNLKLCKTARLRLSAFSSVDLVLEVALNIWQILAVSMLAIQCVSPWFYTLFNLLLIYDKAA